MRGGGAFLVAIGLLLLRHGVLVQKRERSGWLLLPLASITWFVVHEAGIYATVAGVVLGFAVPVMRCSEGPGPGLAGHSEHRFRLISSGFAVPVSHS
jgi:NhaA family Na+:H+ antiporter